MTLTLEEQAGLENMQAFVKHMLSFTVRLVRLDENNKPDGVSSGFIVEREGSWYLLATLHSLQRGRYCIETDVEHEGDPLLLPVGAFIFYKRCEIQPGDKLLDFTKAKEVDFGWAKIDREKLAKIMGKEPRLTGKQVELPIYAGPLNQRPEAGDIYGYAAWNRAQILEASRTFLERDYSCELGLRYLGFDPERRLYRFQPDTPHKGHKYYEGASGAPIADPTGIIVSMLVSGSEEHNVLWGFPIAEMEGLIGFDPVGT